MFLFATSILFSITVNAQKITFADLLHIFRNNDAATFLKGKGFEKDPYFTKFDCYTLNHNTDHEESVWYMKRSTSYRTYDAKYMHSLLKEIKKAYPVILEDETIEPAYHQFGNTSVNIMVNISKTPNTFNSISISHR